MTPTGPSKGPSMACHGLPVFEDVEDASRRPSAVVQNPESVQAHAVEALHRVQASASHRLAIAMRGGEPRGDLVTSADRGKKHRYASQEALQWL